eukprot:CAMPEP_0197699034 /NCGR_PEP_ID=MMETSP1338-20131121/120086_1 /TAXON_ID=43686 ORGANISM="Pelagodinium beii, Strain RCC1491" /NCGR_SAMPLE_ID=MMETSP1338 /ASSEMBLY_ACC=CAM_ASM_000754 /LENGTH=258 /DNA_ID=CAMNT_0043282483 /DNA_START=18 /DNA_END=790 /DNA_ORIENTATION=+
MIGMPSQVAAAQQKVWAQLVEANHESSEAKVNLLVRKEAAGVVIGKQGSTLKGVREQSGAKIMLEKDEVSGHRPCMITGDIKSVLQAEALIADLVKTVPVEFSTPETSTWTGPGLGFDMVKPKDARRAGEDEQESTKLLVPSTSAGSIIGVQGTRLKMLRETYGVQVEMQSSGNAPQWPEDRIIIFKGALVARQSAVQDVLGMAFHGSTGTDQCTLKVLVPVQQVGAVIGKQGATLRSIRERSGISAQVERDEVQGER